MTKAITQRITRQRKRPQHFGKSPLVGRVLRCNRVKVESRSQRGRPAVAILILAAGSHFCFAGPAREHETKSAQVRIIAGQVGCAVELDAAPAGRTNSKGTLVLPEVDPSDHYIHLRCPGQQQETAYFVSLRPGESVDVRPEAPLARANDSGPSPLDAAQAKIELRRDVHQAVRLRAAGRFEEAVELLHRAAKMDPENSDLHRELGITFLLGKDWKRARVEMLEAIRHDPSDADAHNGLGYALEKLGDVDGALKEYRTATHLDPGDPSYRQHYLEALGKFAALQGEKKEKKK